jgi:hypothetical protein
MYSATSGPGGHLLKHTEPAISDESGNSRLQKKFIQKTKSKKCE